MNSIKNLQKLYKEKKMSHIYILETNNVSQLIKDLEDLFYEILETDVILKNNPNYIFIEPEGKNIKKEQILELRRKLSLKPILSKNNLFVIIESEKLSLSSSNSMLKILEEPYENSCGFLITNNVENIILTIRSRSQILKIKYDEQVVDFRYLSELEEYVKLLLSNKNEAFLYNLKLKERLDNKEETVVFVKELLSLFMYFLNVSSDNFEEKKFEAFSSLRELNYNILYNKTNSILAILDSMNFNVNIELILDRIVIEIGDENE